VGFGNIQRVGLVYWALDLTNVRTRCRKMGGGERRKMREAEGGREGQRRACARESPCVHTASELAGGVRTSVTEDEQGLFRDVGAVLKDALYQTQLMHHCPSL